MKLIGKLLAGVLLSGMLVLAAACDTGGPEGDGQTPPGETTVGEFNKTLSVTHKAPYGVDTNQAYARIVEAEDGTLVATRRSRAMRSTRNGSRASMCYPWTWERR